MAKIDMLQKANKTEEALELARSTSDNAEVNDIPQSKLHSDIRLGWLLHISGNKAEAISLLNQCQSTALLSNNAEAQFFVHYYLWKIHGGEGNSGRAAMHLASAKYFSCELDDVGSEIEEVRRL